MMVAGNSDQATARTGYFLSRYNQTPHLHQNDNLRSENRILAKTYIVARIHRNMAIHPPPGSLEKRNVITTSVVANEADVSLVTVYERKWKVLNEAMQSIGYGRYHRRLFVVSGFGWFIDSALPLLAGLILTPIISEFDVKGAYLILAVNCGLLAGALSWGLACDVGGRRWPFNMTLLISGVFTIAAGGSLNFTSLAVLLCFVGLGVGGNIPIDSALFLEFMPSTSQHLLTLLATFWILGQIFVTLVSWPLISHFSDCSSGVPCARQDNMGWRYLLFTLGGFTLVLWCIRFFAFPLHENPRYLLSRGRDDEAVQVVRDIAKFNGVECALTVEDLKALDKEHDGDHATTELAVWDMKEKAKYSMERVKSLFMPIEMATSTVILIMIWSTMGLGTTLYNSFLPYLLASRGATFGDASLSTAYRNQIIITVSAIFSPFIASKAVETRFLGRRGTLAAFCALTGVFLLASTTARNSNALLGWNCGYSFASNAMYGVLYAFTAEVFPTKCRGTGNGVVSTFSRIFGVIAPLIALHVNVTSGVPAYIGGGLTIFAGSLALLVPYEPRGREAI